MGGATGRTQRGRRAGALVVAACLVALGAGPAAGAPWPPDRVAPPAPGEGRPLEDPSDPAPGASFYAQPAPRVALSGIGFAPQAVERLAGSNRFLTAVETSRVGWPGGAAAAVLASGDDYPDALAGSALAGTVGGPLLLTPGGRLDADVAAELRRLDVATVYLVGALSDDLEVAVRGLGADPERLRGEDRYATAFAVAQRAAELGAETATVLVASGEGFADALAASALAAGLRQPILLTRPGLRDLLAERVAELGAQRSVVVGGTAVLPDDAVAGLPGLERAAGLERSATAAAVADRARAAGLAGAPVLVGGESFPAGLSGGTFAGGARRAPLLVTGRRD
ncbi:MAG TPA: cell wall-binding repeat-containing protein, partial [Egibacteraceae bacterium]|nr:cell wall-binding repeat-containing protein [Egibacteraceae bacterium]